MSHIEIIHEAGNFVVREIQTEACGDCLKGWRSGALVLPKDGGAVCTHGLGLWQAGRIGPRGGWQGIGPLYQSPKAARLVCDALAEAGETPRGAR